MNIKIRPMNEHDDLETVAAWFDAVGAEWILDYRATTHTAEESRAELRAWMLGEDGRSCVLVAEADEQPGTILGFAVCLLREDTNTKRLFGNINGLYVDSPFRGMGVGRRLKDAADNWCRENGAAFMKAFIGVGNKAMLRVCKLLGYQPWMVTWVRRFE